MEYYNKEDMEQGINMEHDGIIEHLRYGTGG